MMKTITKQPILFTDVPVADLRNLNEARFKSKSY